MDAGAISPDEARKDVGGYEPLPNGIGKEPLVSGKMLLSDVGLSVGPSENDPAPTGDDDADPEE